MQLSGILTHGREPDASSCLLDLSKIEQLNLHQADDGEMLNAIPELVSSSNIELLVLHMKLDRLWVHILPEVFHWS